ncbi:hypothetical protein [Streptomyces sp. NPDC051572]|uniref:hypothetical protein n=1 Tax=Streptomyces sp. NPDC051572 TaxID=3155802 RepID=UPI00344F44EE
MKAELLKILDGLSVEDHVTATGTDTRGHNVTRTGYLLAPPTLVNARRNGFPTKGWRLFVGAAGTDPSERTTWVTLFLDAGAVERTPEPEVGKWVMSELRHVPGVKATSHTTRILYGGKGGARSSEPSQGIPVTVTYGDDGIYVLWDPATDTTHAAIKLSTKIWWAHLPKELGQNASSIPANEG